MAICVCVNNDQIVLHSAASRTAMCFQIKTQFSALSFALYTRLHIPQKVYKKCTLLHKLLDPCVVYIRRNYMQIKAKLYVQYRPRVT